MAGVNLIEEQLGSIYKIDDEACPRTYIFPDGKFLHLNSYTSHNYVKIDLQNRYGYSKDESQIENYGVIRVNMDSEGFVALSKIPPTERQYVALRKELDECWMPWAWRCGKFMIIEPERDADGYYLKGGFHYYSTGNDRYTADEFIKIIRRYYVTGKLVESLEDVQ